MARSTRLPVAPAAAGNALESLTGLWSSRRPPGRPLTRRRSHELARIPVFATCARRELSLLARWGDLLEVAAGDELVRQDRGDWWFFVVITGRVVLTRDGQPTDELTPGSHFGEAAVM